MIAQKLTAQIGEAMKAKDTLRLSTLRMLSSEFNYEKIAKQHELSEEEEYAVIRREVKKRKDAIEAYTKAGASDRAENEKKELELLVSFLPPEIPEGEIIKIVEEAIAEVNPQGLKDIGKVIGLVKSKAPGADGGKIASLVKEKLA